MEEGFGDEELGFLFSEHGLGVVPLPNLCGFQTIQLFQGLSDARSQLL